MRLAKSCHDEIQASASKCSHFLNSTSIASISASEVKLGVIEAVFGHFDTRLIAKADLNNFMTFLETASDDLKMASEVKSNFLLSKEG